MRDSKKEAQEDNSENIVAVKALHTAEKASLEIKLKGALQEAIELKSEAEKAKAERQISHEEALQLRKQAEEAKETTKINEDKLVKPHDNSIQNKEILVDNSGQVDLNKTLPITDNSDYEDITHKEINPIPKSLYYKPLSKKKTKTKTKSISRFKNIRTKEPSKYEKCVLCDIKLRSKSDLKEHYVMTHPNSMCCDFCQRIFMNMKKIRKPFASEHSSEYKIADITSVTTHCQEFVIDIDI